MSKLRIGIIGCGGIANSKHLPALKAHSELCELVAFCDLVEERAQKAAADYGTPDAAVYTDYRELLADGSIDVVHVLTPNVSHCPITVAAFEAGKHVMCEKPMADTVAAAQQMMDAWRRSGKLFTIGYQNRFRPEVQSLKRACEAGDLGEIYFAKAHAIRRRAVPTWGVFPDKAQQGGGPLIDIGTHALDITLWLMDNYRPVSVSGSVFEKLGHDPAAVAGNLWGPWDPESFQVEDSAFGYIKFENGAAVFLEAAWAINMRESKEASCTLCGTRAGAEFRSGMSFPRDELIYNQTTHGLLTEQTVSALGSPAYFGGSATAPEMVECRQWLKAIAGEGTPLVQPEQAFTVTRVLEAIYRSAALGHEVTLD